MGSKYKCLRPRVIRNSNGILTTVPCGKCSACLTQRSSRNGKLITLEAEKHMYTEFITLSYAPEHLPVCRVLKLNSHYFLLNETPRLSESYENNVVAFSDDESLFTHDILSSVFEQVYDPTAKTPYQFGEGFIPYVSKVDAQLFMKRLRRYLDYHNILKDSNEKKIRYYIASEYGPEHFRPHFHILLFHDSSNFRRRINYILRKTWTFGNIDCTLSRGFTAGYVASYCCSVADMPSIYSIKGLAPFSLHSQFLGTEGFSKQFDEIITEGRKEPPSTVVRYGDAFREVFAPISLQNKLLPRSFRHAISDDYCRYSLLSLCGCICGKYNIEEPTAELIASICRDVDPFFKRKVDSLFSDTLDDSSYLTIAQISLNYYNLCRRFPAHDVRCAIDNYFIYNDYKKLKKQYVSQQEYINRFGLSNKIFLGMFYDNAVIPYRDSRGVAVYREPYSSEDYRLSANFYGLMGFDTTTLSDSESRISCDPDYFDQKRFCDYIYNEKSKLKKHNDRFNNKF